MMAYLAQNAGLYARLALTQTPAMSALNTPTLILTKANAIATAPSSTGLSPTSAISRSSAKTKSFLSLLITQVFNMTWLKALN